MSPSPPGLTAPKQTRSRRTLERIVRASLRILERDGPDGLTVQAIVREADSSVGSFYARFGGKDDLLEYLDERVWREAAERWERALASRDWSGLGLAALVEGSVRLLADAVRSRASYLKALGRAAGNGDGAYSAFLSRLLGDVEELLLERRSEIGHADPALEVRVGLRAVLGVVDSGAGGEPSADADRWDREAAALLMGYLAPGRVRDGGAGEDVDFFDIWS